MKTIQWRVYVEGDDSSLERLAILLHGTDVELQLDAEGPYLHGKAISEASDAHSAMQRTSELLPRLNAAGRLDSPSFQPVQVGSRVSDGAGRDTVFALAHLSGEGRLMAGGDPGPLLTVALLDAARTDTNFAQAVELFGSSPDLGWGDLYKIYELLEHAAAGRLRERTGISKSQGDAFTASANDAGISGILARHAIPRKQQAKRSMTNREAQELIRQMLVAWLRK
jgi:hypothetical protein